MKNLLKLSFVLAILGVVGCSSIAKQEPVALDTAAYSSSNSIAIVHTAMPKVDTNFPGAGCLLCIAAANATHSTLTKHVQTLSAADLASLPSELKELLTEDGIQVVVSEDDLVVGDLPKFKSETPNTSTRDFSELAETLGVSKVLVLDFRVLGVQRNYSGYIPNGAPYGYVLGYAYLVDSASNQYQWFAPISVAELVEGEWDEPENFPKLTNAYYMAIEKARDQILAPFDGS